MVLTLQTEILYGETIVAADAGTVELAQMDNSGYGLYVIINHGNGRKTLYGHTSKLLVQAGESIQRTTDCFGRQYRQLFLVHIYTLK